MNKTQIINIIDFIWCNRGPLWETGVPNVFETNYQKRIPIIQSLESLPGASSLEKCLTVLGLWDKYIQSGRPTFEQFRSWWYFEKELMMEKTDKTN